MKKTIMIVMILAMMIMEVMAIDQIDPYVINTGSVTPSHAVTFHLNNETIGTLSFEKGKLVFEGDADKAAKIFFEQILKGMVDEYIKKNCGEEKK